MILIASLVLFAVACCLPALEFTKNGNKDAMVGINVLGVGWSGIFEGVFGWYANPIAVLSIALGFFGKPKLAAIAGLVALLTGCTTFTLFGRDLPADEGGVTHMMLTRTLPGCYVWLASLAVLPLLAFFKGK